MPVIQFVKEFVLLASQSQANTEGFFPGKTLKVDPAFKMIMESCPKNGASRVECRLYETTGCQDSDIILGLRLKGRELSFEKLLTVLAYVGVEGSSLLDLCPRKEEKNLILGYTGNGYGDRSVVFIEHELEGGVEEFHLHVRPINVWGDDDNPSILVF